MIAALYVETGGPYFGVEGVDPWDATRDAREYAGPHPVVAHPPCKRWGRYWGGGPSAKVKRLKGDDKGMFAHALWAVRTFGGVLEHPEASHAWDWYGLEKPKKHGTWTEPDAFGGRSIYVEQGHYGHRARKGTWLYMVALPGSLHSKVAPCLTLGPAPNCERLDDGYHTAGERAAARESGTHVNRSRLTMKERLETPERFKQVLISIAQNCA